MQRKKESKVEQTKGIKQESPWHMWQSFAARQQQQQQPEIDFFSTSLPLFLMLPYLLTDCLCKPTRAGVSFDFDTP